MDLCTAWRTDLFSFRGASEHLIWRVRYKEMRRLKATPALS